MIRPIPCPICRTAVALKRHCPDTNTTCSWLRCPRCSVTLSPRRRRGFDKVGQPVLWPPGG